MLNPGFTMRNYVIPWLQAGNIPDRFIGFSDKNGKEIYEGDIVYLNDGYERAIVKFGKYFDIVDFYDHRNNQSVFMKRYTQEHLGFYFDKYYSFDGKLNNMPIPYIDFHSSEIKGNIHENPELLREITK